MNDSDPRRCRTYARAKLLERKNDNAIVVGIPHGGVPVILVDDVLKDSDIMQAVIRTSSKDFKK